MAQILSDHDTHSFHRFLDSFNSDMNSSSDQASTSTAPPGLPPLASPWSFGSPSGGSSSQPTPRPSGSSNMSSQFSSASWTPAMASEHDREKQARMAQQTRDLEQWMRVHGAAPAAAVPNRERAYVPRRDQQHQQQQQQQRRQPPPPPPPPVYRQQHSSHRPDSSLLAAMHAAEVQAGFHRRGSHSGEVARSGSSTGGAMHDLRAPIPRSPPSPPSPPMRAPGAGVVVPGEGYMDVKPVLEPSKSTSATASKKRKAAPAAAKPKKQSRGAKPTVDDPPSDPGLNPGPASTPYNIPQPSSSLPPRPPLSSTPSNTARPRDSSTSASRTSASNAAGTNPSKKPALLSAAEKKANHIRSEQKRRAAIRRGYDGLTSVVPSLRAAVEEFEDRVKRAGGTSSKNRRANGAGAGALTGGIEVGGEKIDGRAGPKSEAVVLSKSPSFLLVLQGVLESMMADGPRHRAAVEHVRHLLEQRKELLNRLSDAYHQAHQQSFAIEGGHRIWDEPWDEAADRATRDQAGWSDDDDW